MPTPLDDLGFVPAGQSTGLADIGFVPVAETAAPAPAAPAPAQAAPRPWGSSWVPQAIDATLTTAGGVGGALIGEGILSAPAAIIGAGGGDALAQKINMALGYQDRFKYGQNVAALATAAPGETLVGAGLGMIARQAGKNVAANVGGTNAQTLLDEGRLATGAENALAAAGGAGATAVGRVLDTGSNVPAATQLMEANATRDAVRPEAVKAGYVFNPAEANPTLVNRILASTGGKADADAVIGLHNQIATNNLGAAAIGKPGAPLTKETINQAWREAQAPEKEFAAISADTKAALAELKQAKYDGANAWYKYNNSEPGKALKKNPALAEEARVADAVVAQKQANVLQMAKAAGGQDLADAMKAANVRMGKIGAVETHFNPETNTLSARGLASMQEDGYPLTDELKTIATTYQNFPKALKPGDEISRPAGNKLGMWAAAGLAGEGYHQFGAPGVVLGAVPYMDKPARSLMLSGPWQKYMGQPNYPGATPDTLAQLGRLAAMNVTRPPTEIPSYLLGGFGASTGAAVPNQQQINALLQGAQAQ